MNDLIFVDSFTLAIAEIVDFCPKLLFFKVVVERETGVRKAVSVRKSHAVREGIGV